MPKTSGLPVDSAPTTDDYAVSLDTTSGILKRSLWSNVITMIASSLGFNAGGWTAYTPTWTGVTIGNATVNAAYQQVGKLVTVRIIMVMGSTTSISGNVAFSLPVTANSVYSGTTTGRPLMGLAYVEDLAIAGYWGAFQADSTTRAIVLIQGVNSTYGNTIGATSSVPMTWATGDFFSGTFTYEAA